jgi:Fe-S cluster biogenesis protein NfuA
MADDANVQLIDVSNGIVKVKLTGVCGGVLYSKYELATRN